MQSLGALLAQKSAFMQGPVTRHRGNTTIYTGYTIYTSYSHIHRIYMINTDYTIYTSYCTLLPGIEVTITQYSHIHRIYMIQYILILQYTQATVHCYQA